MSARRQQAEEASSQRSSRTSRALRLRRPVLCRGSSRRRETVRAAFSLRRCLPSLQNAAARLATVGVTPLRKEAIGTRLATGFLQEHDTLTQWVRAQSLTGHSKREALTEARALELGVADYGVGFLTSSSAEILLRRILALAIHSGTGSWQIAEKIEELPTESPLSCVPESLLKEIMEQVKNELKVAALAKQAA